VRNPARLERTLEVTGIKVPSDLTPWGYNWRSYLYANLLKSEVMTMEEKAVMIDLYKTLMGFHTLPWSRKRLVPLDKSKVFDLQSVILHVIYSTDSADVLRAALWQRQAVLDGNFYTDDHVMSLIPDLGGYVRRARNRV